MRLAIGDQIDLTSLISARLEYGHVFNGDIGYRQGGSDHTFQSDSDEIRVAMLFNF